MRGNTLKAPFPWIFLPVPLLWPGVTLSWCKPGDSKGSSWCSHFIPELSAGWEAHVDFGENPVDFLGCRMDHGMAELVLQLLVALLLPRSSWCWSWSAPWDVWSCGSPEFLPWECQSCSLEDSCPGHRGLVAVDVLLPLLGVPIVPARAEGKLPLKSVGFWGVLPAFPLPAQPSRATFQGRMLFSPSGFQTAPAPRGRKSQTLPFFSPFSHTKDFYYFNELPASLS